MFIFMYASAIWYSVRVLIL